MNNIERHTVFVSKLVSRHWPWYGTPAAWACNLVCSDIIKTKHNLKINHKFATAESKANWHPSMALKIQITLATSRGLTRTAERTAAPAAERALSPKPNLASERELEGWGCSEGPFLAPLNMGSDSKINPGRRETRPPIL